MKTLPAVNLIAPPWRFAKDTRPFVPRLHYPGVWIDAPVKSENCNGNEAPMSEGLDMQSQSKRGNKFSRRTLMTGALATAGGLMLPRSGLFAAAQPKPAKAPFPYVQSKA